MTNLDIFVVRDRPGETTIIVGWAPPVGAQGYVFSHDGQRLSSTLDGSMSQVKVARSNLPLTVSALRTLAEGVYPPVEPPPPVDPPPTDPSRVYPPPALVSPRTYIVPAGATTVQLDKAQRDWIVDFGWLERKNSILIYGWDGQRVYAKNYWANIDRAVGGSAYGRGGPRVRSSDGLGPAEVYLDQMLLQGKTIADAVAVDAGTKTVVTIANSRLECSRDTTGVQFADGTEHIDQVQTQGKIGRLRICNSTLNMSDQANPTDAGGKGLMLNKEGGPGFTVDLQYVNFVAKGRTGAVIFQDSRDILVNLGEGVYADTAEVTSAGYKWPGPSTFYPNDWKSNGTAPHRYATFGTGWTGKVLEGRPPGGDYVTRAIKP